MPDPVITAHAIERFQERVANLPDAEARQALLDLAGPALQFGAPFVRLGTGQRIVIANGRVVTVLPKETYLSSLRRRPR